VVVVAAEVQRGSAMRHLRRTMRRFDGSVYTQAEDRGLVRWTMIWIPTLPLSLLGPARPARHMDRLLHPSIPLLIVP
jgi:hypothetical protein